MTDPLDDRDARDRLRASVLIQVLAELGHELSTPLNVLVGRLSLLEEADDLQEAKSHVGPMRRQVDKLVAALDAARAHLPEETPREVAVATLADRLGDALGLEVTVRAEADAGARADPEEVVACLRAMLDHLGGATAVVIERRELERLPVRHLTPGAYVCVVATNDDAAPDVESGTAWALEGARGHARRMRGAVIAPTKAEVLLALQPSA